MNFSIEAVLAFAGAIITGIAYLLGRRHEANAEMRKRVRGAAERANADVAAARVDDPVDELRRRGWVRGVEAPDARR